ncbi:MAG: hypothetical protein AB7V48_07100 [Sedimentibacter sp.]
MLLSNLHINSKTQKILSLLLTLTGVIFILLSKYIGSIAIRIAMISILIFCIANIKMTYKYLTKKEKVNYLLVIAASLTVMFRPELAMLIIGAFLLYISLPPYINAIKTKDYSDIIMLIIYGSGILFAFYCIISSKAALNTVIKLIGVIFTIAGCIMLYDIITNNKPNIDSDIKKFNSFEDTSNM